MFHSSSHKLAMLAREVGREACERSLFEFTRQAWHVLEPHTAYQPHQGTRAICQVLEAVTRRELNRVKINEPPRHGKSMTISVFWPVWEWISRPWYRYLFSSYGADLSSDASVKRRSLIQSAWFRERWGHLVELCGDQNVKTHFENKQTGVMQATSTGGAVTGKGGHRVIIDDPTKTQEGKQDENLPLALKTDIDFFRDTLSTRLDNPNTGAIVLVMHRIHHSDLCGHLDSQEPGRWLTLCLRGEAEEDERIEMNGRVILERKAGEVLDPGRFPKEVLDTMKVTMGPYAYAAQVQQRPSPLEGGMFKRQWWKLIKRGEFPQSFDDVVQGWDSAFKKGRTNDYNVCLTAGRKGGDIYLIDVFRRKMEWPELRRASVNLYVQRQPRLVLIEEAASGISLAQDLRTISPPLPIMAIKLDADKVSRASSTTGYAEAGKVFLPDGEPWVLAFMDELAEFPTAAHDDQVDAFSLVMNYFRKNPSAGGFLFVGQARHWADPVLQEGRPIFADYNREIWGPRGGPVFAGLLHKVI
jgi:predicted phage terminase large subunit-like protein